METYFSRFIFLVAIYPEAGVSFSDTILHWKKAQEWRIKLDTNLIPEGKMITNYHNYDITLTITSSVLINELVVKGPKIDRRNKSIGYALWIPYSPVVNNSNPLTKLTEYFKQGVREVLLKLDYPESSIEKALNQISDKLVEE